MHDVDLPGSTYNSSGKQTNPKSEAFMVGDHDIMMPNRYIRYTMACMYLPRQLLAHDKSCSTNVTKVHATVMMPALLYNIFIQKPLRGLDLLF